jgi:hypothetical protein
MPLVSVGPETAMLNSHFRKEAENVPVFRGLFKGEIGFGGQIAGIVDTSGILCARRDFWGGREN